MAHKVAIVCEQGLEDISALEVKELVGAKCKVFTEVVTCEVGTEEAMVLCYRMQSARRVMLLLGEGKSSLEDIKKAAAAAEVDGYFSDEKTFLVKCEREGEHDFNSVDVERAVGAAIVGAEIDFENPALKLFVFVKDEKFYFGVDLAGFDLSLRDYKVFNHAAALRGTVAYGIVRLVGFERGKKLLNYFSKSGVIEIEAALFASGKSVNYYRKDKLALWSLPQFAGFEIKDTGKDKFEIVGVHSELGCIMAGKKNAKIAGVEKMINFTRVDADWLDLKFEGYDGMIVYASGGEMRYVAEVLGQASGIASRVVTVGVGKRLGSVKGLKLVGERVVERGKNKLFIEIYGI